MAKSKLPAEARESFREHGRRGGKLSGPARMLKMTPEERSGVAKFAVAAREAKRRKGRYALALPAPDVLQKRLKVLDAESPLEVFCFRRVALHGADPAELAKVMCKPQEEILLGVQEVVRKLNSEKLAPTA